MEKVAAELRARGPALPPTIAADHPLARTIGHDRAQRIADTWHGRAIGRFAVAADRRALILRMSLERRRVADIAAAAQCSYGYVVDIRGELRAIGKL